MTTEEQNIAIVRRYFRAIELRESIDQFVSPDIIQETFPNRILPTGGKSGLAEMKLAAERGKKVITDERYEIVSFIANGNSLAVETIWTGVLQIPYESLPIGGTMRARFAVFFEFEDGKILKQRNYDCFDPF